MAEPARRNVGREETIAKGSWTYGPCMEWYS